MGHDVTIDNEYLKYLLMQKNIILTTPEFEEVCKGMLSILKKEMTYNFTIDEVRKMAKAFIESYQFMPDGLPDKDHWIYIYDLCGLVKECPLCGTQTMGFDEECPHCHKKILL